MEYLARYHNLLSIRIHAWCLMTNHFHLLLETQDRPALSEFMRRLLTAYTVYFNRRHQRHGHLFQGRFKSFVVDKADYLLELSRYIHCNPKRPESYTGSSLRYYINGGEPNYLYSSEILSWFDGNRRKYAEFVQEGFTEEITPEILRQRYIGGTSFADRMDKRLKQAVTHGTRSQRSKVVNVKRMDERDHEKADQLLQLTAGYFEISGETLRNARWSGGRNAQARTILINLLRDHVPWNHRRIAQYMGIKGKSVITHHLKKAGGDAGLTNILLELKKSIPNGI